MSQNRVQWALNTTQFICSHIDMVNKMLVNAENIMDFVLDDK